MSRTISGVAGLVFLLVVSVCSPVPAEESKGPPPTNVVLGDVSTGKVAPVAEFIGTVYYPEVSKVASEVAGRVEVVNIDEGQRVDTGEVLVKLNSDLLTKTLEAKQASYEQARVEVQSAERDLERVQKLYTRGSEAERVYDEYKFKALALEKKTQSLAAEVAALQVQLDNKTVYAPFSGVVIERNVVRGDWVDQGDTVASIGRDDVVDVTVNVPETVIRNVKPGEQVVVRAADQELKAQVYAIVPKGDVSTRTFPVKVRIDNSLRLIEGMEARVRLPAGEPIGARLLPRDAVITQRGRNIVVAVVDSKAVMIPVDVVGYDGMMAGVKGNGIKEGMQVVVKGNERLRPGQPVNVVQQLVQ